MAAGEPPEKTTVSDRGIVTVPAAVRRRLDIRPGDKLHWNVDENGEWVGSVAHQREGVFDDFEFVDAGETNAVALEDEFGAN